MSNSFSPINSTTTQPAMVAQINRNFAKLDGEAVTKKFGQGESTLLIGKLGDGLLGMQAVQGEKPTMTIGKYDGEHYGLLFYEDGVPTQLIGQAPDDGRIGNWTAKPGENVISLLGG